MKNTFVRTHICLFLFIMAFFISCNGQEKLKSSNDKQQINDLSFLPKTEADSQISAYIRNAFQDKNGNLWFGTNGDGVAHFNEGSLSYISNEQGFGGQQITGMTEDMEKNIWFATDQGVVKYDWSTTEKGEKIFTNYSSQKIFGGKRFWSIFSDSKGTIWAGTGKGVFRFSGLFWEFFDLPFSKEEDSVGLLSDVTVWSISEDRKGNLWFGTDGKGAFKYDGRTVTQYTVEDGLTDNSVDNILEDKDGNVWFGTRFGGVSRYDGKTFTNYTDKDSISNNEVCVIYEDKVGNIWFSSEGYGVYRFDGESFTNYSKKQGLGVRAVQTIFEDKQGRFWVGGGGGLYRFDGESFFHVTKGGPWE